MEGGGEGREVAGDRIALSTLLAFLFGGQHQTGSTAIFAGRSRKKRKRGGEVGIIVLRVLEGQEGGGRGGGGRNPRGKY